LHQNFGTNNETNRKTPANIIGNHKKLLSINPANGSKLTKSVTNPENNNRIITSKNAGRKLIKIL